MKDKNKIVWWSYFTKMFHKFNVKVVSLTFLVVCFSNLEGRTCATWKNVFLFYFSDSSWNLSESAQWTP